MTTEEHMASINTGIALLDERLKTHTEADEANFTLLRGQLNIIESKVDELRLSDAARKGTESNGTKRASIFGGGVAAGIVAFVESVKYLVNG